MTVLKFFLDERWFNTNDFTIMTLVISNKGLLNNYMTYLFNEFSGKEDYWKIEIDKAPKDLDEFADFIPNYFQLDINTKRNINALYKMLKKLYYEKLENDISTLKEQTSKIVKEIAMDFDVELVVNNEIREDDLFKIMDLRFSDYDLTYKEKLIKYLLVTNELRGINIFFCMNLHEYFSNDDINDIVKELDYRKIKLINLEFYKNYSELAEEFTLEIDSDLCSI